jgi:pyruvate/2-oxoglutarate/acetoin dehydrogenase E1 component
MSMLKTAPSTESKERILTYAQALNEALSEEMTADPSVVLLGEDIAEYGGVYTVTRTLLDRFGKGRVIDTPISEAGFVGAALGLALTGYRPVVEIMFVDFLFVAGDQLFNHIGKTRYISGGRCSVPLVIRTQQGASSGKAAQHSQSLEAIFCHIPGWIVVAPSTPADAKGLLKAAVRDNNPVVFLEHKALYFTKGTVATEAPILEIGKANIVREGSDITLISYSKSMSTVLEAANLLGEDGIQAEVIDLRTLKPLDMETILASVSKTNRALIVHESHGFCGLGAELSSTIQERAFADLDGPVQRLAASDNPIPYNRVLERATIPQVEDVVAKVRDMLRY